MRDFLLDLVEHTYDLGCIELIKITGDKAGTLVDGMADDRSVVVSAKFAQPIGEFDGTFGMPNLGKLKILLGLEPYKENATINIKHQKRGEEAMPVGMHFENDAGDFKNDYRFMIKEIIEEKLSAARFKGASWNVEVEPTIAGVERMKMQALANSDETTFKAKVEEGNLKFYFGDHSTHAGEFVFHTDVTGMLTQEWLWPVSHFIKIMDLVGDKTIRISDQGATEITVDSGIAVYTYVLPAQTK